VTYFWLNVVTASRLLLCGPIWLWCWWKRPRGMALWMTLAVAWFLVTDHLDGIWARENGLVSELGYWLDHVGDFVFYGSVVLTLVFGTREAAAGHRRKRSATPPPKAPSPPAP
jgi:phosphatidylglycerophosphate synthase